MNNPKILALLPFLVKGALSLQVLREMRRRDFDVTVAFCMDASHIYTPDDMEDFRADGCLIDLTRYSHGENLDAVWDEMQRRGTELILQIGATRLYHHLPYWKERNPALRIVDTLYNEVGHTLNHFLYERCMDGVIVESDHMLQFIERNSAKEEANARVVRSGIDTDWLVPAAVGDRQGLVIGYVGRMSAEKNPLGFIDIVEAIYEDLPSATFVLAGEGDQAKEVQNRVQASPAGARLRYDGYAPDMRVALQNLDVLILPSKLDGRPNIVMEANACGVPVIGAPVGGVPELISEGNNGYLVDPKNTRRIAEILTGLATDPGSLAALKQSSRSFAENNFDRRLMMENYANAFRYFCNGRPIPAY